MVTATVLLTADSASHIAAAVSCTYSYTHYHLALLSCVQALPKLAASNAQIAILGTGKAKYEQMVKQMGSKNPKFKGVVKFSAPLAHMITAGADFILVPSRYECVLICGCCCVLKLHCAGLACYQHARAS